MTDKISAWILNEDRMGLSVQLLGLGLDYFRLHAVGYFYFIVANATFNHDIMNKTRPV
jgi:hypothetical protein